MTTTETATETENFVPPTDTRASVMDMLLGAQDLEAKPAKADKPTPGPKGEVKGESAKYARALTELQKAQSEGLTSKKELDTLRARLARIESDPLEALKAAKTDFDTLAQRVLKGEIKAPTQEAVEGEVKDAKVLELEARLAKFEEKERTLAEQEVYQGEIAVVKEVLAGDDFAIAAAFPWAPEAIYTMFYDETQKTGKPPVLADVVRQFEDKVAGDLRGALSNERTLKTLLQDKAVKAQVMTALGLSDTNEKATPQRDIRGSKTQGNTARVLTQRDQTTVPARTSETLSQAQRRERTMQLLISQSADD